MRRWPDKLPVPMQTGYGMTPAEQTIRTDMEAGAVRVRRITVGRRDVIEAAWRMTWTEMALFEAWFYDAPWSLLGDSDDLTPWSRSQATLTADAIVGPDDVLADRLIETAVNASHVAFRQLLVAPPASTAILLQATKRAAGRNFARIAMLDRAGTVDQSTVDLSTGTLGSSANLISREIEPRGNGRWRMRLIADTGIGAGTPDIRINIFQTGVIGTYLGDGTSGIDICEVMARLVTGHDLFAHTDAAGRVQGA